MKVVYFLGVMTTLAFILWCYIHSKHWISVRKTIHKGNLELYKGSEFVYKKLEIFMYIVLCVQLCLAVWYSYEISTIRTTILHLEIAIMITTILWSKACKRIWSRFKNMCYCNGYHYEHVKVCCKDYRVYGMCTIGPVIFTIIIIFKFII